MNIVHGFLLHLVNVANTVEQIIFIIDLKGIKLKTLSNKLLNPALKKTIALCIQYFPEILFKGFIVNTPMFFQQTWNEIEKILPKTTAEKIRVIGKSTDAEINLLVFVLFVYDL